jgi:erythromycin esterase-like protein
MGARGEHNVGMLARRAFGDDAVLVGFGTHHGVVAAATDGSHGVPFGRPCAYLHCENSAVVDSAAIVARTS